MTDVIRDEAGKWSVIHDGKEVEAGPFETEHQAWAWADANIDDQVYDSPNILAEPLKYRGQP